MSRFGNGLTNFGHLYGRNMRQMPRIPAILVFGLMMPIIQLLLFGSIFSRTTDIPGNPYAGVDYQAYIAPAIVLLTCFVGMANASAAFIVDLRTGYFDKLRTTPANPGMVIVARLCAEMTRVAIQATIILLLTLVVGAPVATGLLGGVAMILLAVLFSGATTGLLVTILAMKTKSDQATQSMFPLFFIFLFLSTAYMPEALLPDWLQTAVQFNPIDYVIQGLRALMLDGWADAGRDVAATLGFTFGFAMLFGAFNMRAYRRLVD